MSNKIFNTKSEGINILKEYFSKFNINELGYYLENINNYTLAKFFNSNVYEPENIELKNLFLKHYKIVIKKIFELTTELNYINQPIKISFISNSIHWNDIFVIKNNIFVKYNYLIKIFELIEYNEYTNMDDIYIEGKDIFDIGLLKNISYSIYSILQNLNSNAWNEFISNKYGCSMIPITNIKFASNYKIIQEPNVDFVQDKVPIYWFDIDNIYTSFNSICSKDNTFSPYYEFKIIKLEYKNGYYIETKQIDIDTDTYKNNDKIKLFIKNLIPTPYENKSKQITNTIIYN